MTDMGNNVVLTEVRTKEARTERNREKGKRCTRYNIVYILISVYVICGFMIIICGHGFMSII